MMDMGRRQRSFAGLVDELDERLPQDRPAPDDPPIGRTGPTWLAFLLMSIGFVGIGSAILGPVDPYCEFGEAVCRIEHLDIDALLLTVPEAELFDVLPSIDVVDPEDRFTLGDVLRLDAVRDLDPTALLSPAQLDELHALVD